MSIVCETDKLFRNRKSFVWPNYYILEKALWKQKSWCKSELQATIEFGGYIFWRWYLRKKKNCKYKYHDVKVKSMKQRPTLGLTSKFLTRTLKNLDPEKPCPGPWKTRTLKNMDPEKWNKYGIKKCLPLESLIMKMRYVISSLKVFILTSISKLSFSS